MIIINWNRSKNCALNTNNATLKMLVLLWDLDKFGLE